MRALVACAVGLTALLLANAATAYVAVVATSIPLSSEGSTSKNREQLNDAVRSAIRDVLDHAIAFIPTVVTLQNAKVVGGRLYILLFIADEDGAPTIEALSTDGPVKTTPQGQGDGEPMDGSGGPSARGGTSKNGPVTGPSL